MATNGNPITMKSLIEVYLSTKETAFSEEENKLSPIPSVPALVGSPVDGALAVPSSW